MKIISIFPRVSHFVSTDDEPYPDFIRWSADSWENIMGESSEPIYDCEELEKLYQEHLFK